jgi:UDP-sugar pyrophosphorylase
MCVCVCVCVCHYVYVTSVANLHTPLIVFLCYLSGYYFWFVCGHVGFRVDNCVPRHKTDPNKSLVINVEYNQLDPLLRTQGDCKGDVADPQTGYSPFPGNSNILVIEMAAYAKTLRGEDQGVVLEFVNPKYKDDTRTKFKKPTRLECMMQDIPKLFQKEMGAEANIGFTMFERWFTFSPAKNSLEAGQEAVQAGNTAPGTMSSAESDKYVQNQRKLKHLGVDLHVTELEDCVMVAGIPVSPGPRIVLCPSFGISQQEYVDKIKGSVSLTQRSSLVLEGHHLTLKGLKLDGALIIRTGDDSHVTVDGLIVQNEGCEFQELDPHTDYPETVRIRGYTMNKKEIREYIINEPGHFIIDASGEVRKLD